jgi:hypothetical protein
LFSLTERSQLIRSRANCSGQQVDLILPVVGGAEGVAKLLIA